MFRCSMAEQAHVMPLRERQPQALDDSFDTVHYQREKQQFLRYLKDVLEKYEKETAEEVSMYPGMTGG